MKQLPKILLILISILAVGAFLWVIFQADSSLPIEEMIGKTSIAFIIILAVITTIITITLFLIYKVRDVIIHPSHLKEILIVFGIVVVAIITGFALGGSEAILKTDGSSFTSEIGSRLIGAGIIGSIVLIIVATLFLLFDTVKAVFK